MTETQPPGDWQRLLDRLIAAWPPSRWRDVGVVVGCSGGADSVCLLRALAELRQSTHDRSARPPRGFLVAAHFNHGLRGEASQADERFVLELAAELQARTLCGRTAAAHRDEASMSDERMAFLVQTAKAQGARYLALAHSADDNVETMLHHLIRGTGPAGLAGIGSPRAIDEDLVLVRPLLRVPRDQIRQGLSELGQAWREDASNANTDYRRNWIRHELIPLIQTQYPDATGAMSRAIDGQRDWRCVIDRMAQDWIHTHRQCESPLTLRRDAESDRAIVTAAAQILWTDAGWPRGEMTREHWLRLAATVIGHDDERYTLPGKIDVIASSDQLRLIL